MAKQENASHRLYLLGILLLFPSLLYLLTATYFTWVHLLSLFYLCSEALLLCGVALLIYSRPAAARQSQPERRRFNLGLSLVILSSLSMRVVFSILFVFDLAAGYLLSRWSGQRPPPNLGDVPAPLDFSMVGRVAMFVVVVMFACGVYQLLRIKEG